LTEISSENINSTAGCQSHGDGIEKPSKKKGATEV
jgi:hypothetical protein